VIASQKEEEFDAEEVEQLESTLIDSVVAMVLKLNDATFRPFFAQLVEQEGPSGASPAGAITFYKFLAAFFDKFKVSWNRPLHEVSLLTHDSQLSQPTRATSLNMPQSCSSIWSRRRPSPSCAVRC
jgi:hypothetical protein